MNACKGPLHGTTGTTRPFTTNLDMERPSSPLDLAQAPLDFIGMILEHLNLKDRVTCALVCKAWAKAVAATHSSILKRGPQHISCMQQWLGKHGIYVKVLQLHECNGAALTALPCAHLQDLLLQGVDEYAKHMQIDRKVVGNIAAATKLTSVSLSGLAIACRQADVVSALTALPNLQQLTWRGVQCNWQPELRDSALLQHLTMLTRLELHSDIEAEALQHLGSFTKLQHFSIEVRKQYSIEVRQHAEEWAAAGCAGLQQLKALTALELYNYVGGDIPIGAQQLTALQQLDVWTASPSALNGLRALTRLTLLRVRVLTGLSLESAPLQLPALQHLELELRSPRTTPMSFLASCTQLRVLKLGGLNFIGPGSLVTSTMLQHLKLSNCSFQAADGAAGPVSWQQGFPGLGRLPHLTSLELAHVRQHSYVEGVVAYCSSLRDVHIHPLQDSVVSVLARLPDLTSLHLIDINEHLCTSLAQLTGLRELTAHDPGYLSFDGLKHIAALKQLTSLAFKLNLEPRPWDPKSVDSVQALMADRLPGYAHAIINKVSLPTNVCIDVCVCVCVCVLGEVSGYWRCGKMPN